MLNTPTSRIFDFEIMVLVVVRLFLSDLHCNHIFLKANFCSRPVTMPVLVFFISSPLLPSCHNLYCLVASCTVVMFSSSYRVLFAVNDAETQDDSVNTLTLEYQKILF